MTGEDDVCYYTDKDVRKITVTEEEPKPVPTLTKSRATVYARRALAEQFENSYRHGYRKRISCKRRTRTRQACRVSWNIGDIHYKGSVGILRTRNEVDESLSWDYSLNMVAINQYCVATRGRNCRERIRLDFGYGW